MESGNFLVKFLGNNVDLSNLIFVSGSVFPEFNLSHHLVGEGVGHDERRVASGTSEIHETSFSKDEYSVTIREFPSVNLRLDVESLDARIVLKSQHVNFVVEVTNVAHNCVVLHLCHVVHHNDSSVSSGSDEDISFLDYSLEFLDIESFHEGLKSTNGVDFSHGNSGTASFEGSSASFSDISISADEDFLPCNHHISCSHNSIR